MPVQSRFASEARCLFTRRSSPERRQAATFIRRSSAKADTHVTGYCIQLKIKQSFLLSNPRYLVKGMPVHSRLASEAEWFFIRRSSPERRRAAKSSRLPVKDSTIAHEKTFRKLFLTARFRATAKVRTPTRKSKAGNPSISSLARGSVRLPSSIDQLPARYSDSS